MEEIVIFGIGGHAKVVFDVIVKENKYKAAAFFSLDKDCKSFLGLPHYHQSELVKHNFSKGIVAIGDNFLRQSVVEFIKKEKPKFEFIKAIHPMAAVATSVKIGDGSVVMAQAAVNIDSQVGTHVIVNTLASVDHDANLGSFSSVAPGAVLGGNVSVGDFSAISIGAVVKHGVKIGQHTVVGAGAVVLKDIENFKIAYGNPCSVIRDRKAGEKYL